MQSGRNYFLPDFLYHNLSIKQNNMRAYKK
jgi:hypothetical protein